MIVLFIVCLFSLLPVQMSATTVLHKTDMFDLSNNAIICMHQDRDGFLWIGTYDGLNLYNGKDTYVYRFELNNKNSLCSNIIHKIADAEPGYLWISTSLGINKFSLKERVVTESYPGYMECTLLAGNDKGVALAVAKDGYISCDAKESDGFRDLPWEGISREGVKALFSGRGGAFFMVLSSGVLKTLTPEFTPTAFQLASEERRIHDTDLLYASNEGSVIYLVDIYERLYSYRMGDQQKTFLANLSGLTGRYGAVSGICSFRSALYLSFRNGMVVDINSPGRVVDMKIGVFCLMKDKRQDILWIGTDGQGIRMFYDKPDLFGSILLENLPVNVQNPIRSVYTDSEGSLWIGTKGDGIIRIRSYASYDDKPVAAADVVRYTIDNGLSSNRVYCFRQSEHHPLIWIGTEGPGLSYYSLAEQKVKTLRAPADLPPIGAVHALCEVNDSTLWLATTGQGLLEVHIGYEKEVPIVHRIRTDAIAPEPARSHKNLCKEFQSMIYDNDSTLFLGSRGGYGMVIFNIFSRKYDFLQMNNIENPAIGDVLSLCRGTDSTFYIGASSGFTAVKFFGNRPPLIRHFDNSDGIANDMIHGILWGADSCAWLSTNKGLTKFNPRNDFFHNYRQPNFDVVEFSDNAYWKCPYTGRLFFGGVNGLVWVNKQTEPESQYRPDFHFFELQMDKELVSLYGCGKTNGQEGQSVRVPASVRSFSISFVAPDYINGENYEYAYSVEGYDPNWTELQKNNKVSFTNVPPGNYVLKVRYRNDVIDSEASEYTLRLKVLPPLYLTAWAKVAYILLGIILFVCVLYLFRRRIIHRQQQINKKLEEQQKEKLYESKLNFFTHITHELCTPLTLINGVENYIRAYATSTADQTLGKYATVLKDNVGELNELIQEILDFRKAEDAGFNDAHIRRTLVSALLRTQFEWFYPLSVQNRIRFNISAPDNLYWNTDPVYLKKIMTNLLSNAFKYTTEGGSVAIALSDDDGSLILRVHNTGQGIREEDREALFDRYRILETLDSGEDTGRASRNGLGLFICYSLVQSLQGEIKVSSEEGQFAEFTVVLPRLEAEPVAAPKQPDESPMPTAQPSAPATSHTEHASDKPAKPLVLVVDDHKDIVWLIAEALSDAYEVKEAYSAEEALALMEVQTPALIITDVMMPVMSGLELIEHVKGNKYSRHIPLIIVSAKISDTEQSAGLNIGADAYLTKPFSPLVLHAVADRLVASKKELKDYFYSPESAYQYADGQLTHQEDKEFMDSVVAIIKANIGTEGLGPDLIAESLHINTRILYRRFKKISTLTPSDFIKDYRLTYAAQLLVNTNMSVQEIVYSVGISNKSYFYREFARKYNMTPGEYRSGELKR